MESPLICKICGKHQLQEAYDDLTEQEIVDRLREIEKKEKKRDFEMNSAIRKRVDEFSHIQKRIVAKEISEIDKQIALLEEKKIQLERDLESKIDKEFVDATREIIDSMESPEHDELINESHALTRALNEKRDAQFGGDQDDEFTTQYFSK